MAQTIILKRSAVAGKLPTFADLRLGEIAINTYDGKIFLKKDDGSEAIVEFNGNVDVPVPAGAVNAVQLNAGNGSLDAVSMGAAGHVLTSNGTDAPTWEPTTVGTVTTVDVSGGTTGLTTSGGPVTTNGTITLGGTLAVANGGTGVTTQAAFQAAALPIQTSQTGKFLTTNGTVATWATIPGGNDGTVTSVDVSGGTTGLTVSGGPVTTAGTLTLGGTLAIANGGSGATTSAGFQAAALPAQASQTGKVLSTDGTAASWIDLPAGNDGTVTSVGVSGGTTGLTTTGGPVTSSGVITLNGTLNVANGGTGVTTAAALRQAAVPAQSGNSGKVLSTDGTNSTWIDLPAGNDGTVTSVGVSGGTTGLTTTGGPVTSSGSITLSGTLNVANGGTGVTSAGALRQVAVPAQTGNSGKVLSTDGTDTSWVTLPATTNGTVTSVGVSGGTTGLTTTGGPVTANGTITLGGTLAVANGGTGVTTQAALQEVALPAQAANAGKILSTNGTVASWIDAPTASGTVTSVGVSGGTTGLTTTGGPVTNTGTITLGGVLGVANGGTGVTTTEELTALVLPDEAGYEGLFLMATGAGGAWVKTVTEVDVSGGTTGLTFSGSPIDDVGTITMGGTLGIASGGTGATTATSAMNNISPATTAGDMIIRGLSGHSRVPIGSVGDVLTVSGGSTVEWRPAGGAMYIPVVENDVHTIPEGITNVHMYRPQGGPDVQACVVQFPPNPVDNQAFSLYFGIEISALLLTAQSGITFAEQLNYVRDGETARWIYNAAASQWWCIENPRHMFVVTQGNIGTAGSDMILDVNNIRFTLKYRTGASTQATAQTITGSEMIDLRWVSIYNGAIDASAYDGYTLTTTPVVVDSVIYDASNELPHIHLRENNRIWRIHFFASANGARTTFWAKRVV